MSDLDDHRSSKRHCRDLRTPEADVGAAARAWDHVVAWVKSHGGYVHPSLVFSADDRKVRVSSAIEADVLLMKIPSQCLLTPESLQSSPRGRELLKAVDCTAANLNNDRNDLLMAFYLAYLSILDGAASDCDADGRFASYAATFPHSSSYDALPRRWTHEQLESLLGGTALLVRARKDRDNLRSDYDAVDSAWMELITKKVESGVNGESKGQSRLPPYELFNDMYAAVSSRGFAGLGSNDGEVDAMVPLLDLLDHKRGTDCKRDVRYYRGGKEEGESDVSTTQGMVFVTTDHDLAAGSTVCDTYGAKGNSQLLSRYGFCLEDNIEPDGSSNDVFEFAASPEHPPVELRAGPRSYTYGGLVRALELFHERTSNVVADMSHTVDVGKSSEEDMEAFLDQCNELDENGAFEMMYCDTKEEEGNRDDEDGTDGSVSATKTEECSALDKLAEALEIAQQGYSLQGEKLEAALNQKDSSPAYFAAILVQSEMRTIRLFQRAVRKIRLKIGADESIEKEMESTSLSGIFDGQVDELVAAYLSIRHPNLV